MPYKCRLNDPPWQSACQWAPPGPPGQSRAGRLTRCHLDHDGRSCPCPTRTSEIKSVPAAAAPYTEVQRPRAHRAVTRTSRDGPAAAVSRDRGPWPVLGPIYTLYTLKNKIMYILYNCCEHHEMESCSDGQGQFEDTAAEMAQEEFNGSKITPDDSENEHELKIIDGAHVGPQEYIESAPFHNIESAPVHNVMGWKEKQVRRKSLLARAHTMPVTRRRDSVTAEDEDICALRTRVLSKMAQDRGNSKSPSPGSPAHVKFSRSRRSSVDAVQPSVPNDMDGFFDMSLTPCVLINQIPVIENRPITTMHPVSVTEHDAARQEKAHDKGPALPSRRRRFSCSMPARAMKTARAPPRPQPPLRPF